MRIAIVDTMFARGDMGSLAEKTMLDLAKQKGWKISIERKTVPGVKDIPLALLQLLESGCNAGIVFGMPGAQPIDKTCSHEASLGIQKVQLMTRKIVLECFVHEDEAKNDEELGRIMYNRAYKHSINLLWLLFSSNEISKRAGTGERQGFANASQVKLKP